MMACCGRCLRVPAILDDALGAEADFVQLHLHGHPGVLVDAAELGLPGKREAERSEKNYKKNLAD